MSRGCYEHPTLRPWGLTLREAFSGRREKGAHDFLATFGDYVNCTVPCTHNSMSSRTDDGLVMLPTGNITGNVKMKSLATGALITILITWLSVCVEKYEHKKETVSIGCIC